MQRGVPMQRGPLPFGQVQRAIRAAGVACPLYDPANLVDLQRLTIAATAAIFAASAGVRRL